MLFALDCCFDKGQMAAHGVDGFPRMHVCHLHWAASSARVKHSQRALGQS